MAAKLEKLLRIFAYLMGKDYFCIRFYTMGFRSSVGLEQQPSKLWVLGSNPNGITSPVSNPQPFMLPFFKYASLRTYT